jgi:hypothetical protein
LDDLKELSFFERFRNSLMRLFSYFI